MPIPVPRLDDRRYQDLVDDLVRRIPAHTPEWTNPRAGDPGRTIIELFAWLAETILYRANLVPERQRLAFLSLLGMPLRPALPATGLVALTLDERARKAVQLLPFAEVSGAARFETLAEVTVPPCSGECYYKRPPTTQELKDMKDLLAGLRDLYSLDADTVPYITTRLYAGRTEEFDIPQQSIDASLWIALLAPKEMALDAVRTELAGRLLNIGLSPVLSVPRTLEDSGPLPRIPYEVAISRVVNGKAQYLPLDVLADTTEGLRRQGVLRVALPDKGKISAPSNNVRDDLLAGVGDNPPRIDDPERKDRVVAWLRFRTLQQLEHLGFSWVAVHAVAVDQMETIRNKVIGVSDGTANQHMTLPAGSVDAATIQLDVEEEGYGWRAWTRVDDIGFAGRESLAYTLDAEAGRVRFGDGIRGRVPPAGYRVRVNGMRAGGGAAGNLPPQSLKEIKAQEVTGAELPKIGVAQILPTAGGEDAETLSQAEQRLPAFLRHSNRAVTEQDIRQLAAETPGQKVGRVELLPMFLPQQRRTGVPGVVTVMTLPAKGGFHAPNPRADRPFLSAVDSYLRARKPLSTELYVIGCQYVPIGLSVAVTVRDGFGYDEVLNQVREALRQELWPLAPGGPGGAGWPLQREVRPLELEVAVARVPGVETVAGIRMFVEKDGVWQVNSSLRLELWQFPEVLAIAVSGDGRLPENIGPDGSLLDDLSSSGAGEGKAGKGYAVPVVPAVC